MRQYVEPFIQGQIASERVEDEVRFYEDAHGQLLAQVYMPDGQFCSATFYGKGELHQISKDEAVQIAETVKQKLGQNHFQLQSVEQEDGGYLVEFRRFEPLYGIIIAGDGMFVTVMEDGFVSSVTIHEQDIVINYPEQLISPQQARAIIQQQPIMQLGIAREMDWQYTYKPNYDLFGVDPDGTVRLWSEDEAMKDASFEPLPNVKPIEHLQSFIIGGRNGQLETFESAQEKRWAFETEDEMPVDGDAFTRACQVVKFLTGEFYELYHFEQFETLRKLLHMEEQSFVTYRFVPIYEGISFDFDAIAISVDTETNQIASVRYPIIPFEQFATLQKPTISLQQANAIASELIDVELFLESKTIDANERSFVYTIHYPTSPTGASIQFIDAFTGEIHWIDNR